MISHRYGAISRCSDPPYSVYYPRKKKTTHALRSSTLFGSTHMSSPYLEISPASLSSKATSPMSLNQTRCEHGYTRSRPRACGPSYPTSGQASTDAENHLGQEQAVAQNANRQWSSSARWQKSPGIFQRRTPAHFAWINTTYENAPSSGDTSHCHARTNPRPP